MQTGERLAAKLADSQAALIRDDTALTGPLAAFKTALTSAKPDATGPATPMAAGTPADSGKAATPQSMLAATGPITSAAQTESAAKASPSRPGAPVFQTPVVQQVGTRLVETAANGGGRVIMDLRPEHLGRVTIDVDVRDDGRVTATVLVENPEALEQLRRDAGQLEQALRDSGLNPEQNSLNFALREQNQGGSGREGRRGQAENSALTADAEVEETPAATQQSVVPGLGVIDIRI